MKFTFNKFYFIWSLLLFGTEVLIALYTTNWIRAYFGDFLVVILLYCLIKSFFLVRNDYALTGVLLFSYLIETLQYFRFVEIIRLDHIPIANTLIGTSFSWIDMLMYTLGILFTAILERILSPSFIKTTSNE